MQLPLPSFPSPPPYLCVCFNYASYNPADEILRDADTADVAFLVVGDPLGYVACKTITVCCKLVYVKAVVCLFGVATSLSFVVIVVVAATNVVARNRNLWS